MGKKSGNEDGTLRHIKYREKTGGKIEVPSIIEFVTVGNGIGGTPRGIIVNMSHFKYLFNCGEGTQRIAAEHKMKISRLEQIFVTYNSWENVGGLLGLCLTLESAGVPKVMLHGPPNVEMLVSSSCDFAKLHSLKLEKCDKTMGVYEDSAMKVEFIPINASMKDDRPAKKRRLSGPETGNNMSIVYACKPHPKPRNISLEKLAELNIPAGPHLALLKEGHEVTLANGLKVKPDDVLTPAEVSNPFLVVECPTEAFLEDLTTNTDIMKYQNSDGTVTEYTCIIIHFTPSSVFRLSAYQAWMERFGARTRHLVLNELGSDVASQAIYEIQAKLNLLNPHIFPLLPHQLTPLSNSNRSDKDNLPVVYGQTNLKYKYRGKDGRLFSWENCINLDNDAFTKESRENPELVEEISNIQDVIKQHHESSQDLPNYPEILFLGTGSAVPNKVRNVSAIWVNMSEDKSVLLDCGENTFGQLYRHYVNFTTDMLRRLKAVFISHLHADHHLGLFGLVLERHKRLCNDQSEVEPLVVLAPGAIRKSYEMMDSVMMPIKHLVRIVPLEELYVSKREECMVTYNSVLELLELNEIKAVRVAHRQFPHGIVIEHRTGWKLTYSGDTMPSEKLIESGRGSDILIHEATMEDFLAEDAKEKRHSTTSQAIETGIKMGAKFTLLTHFSQRYAKVPLFNEKFVHGIGIAFDNMRISKKDLTLLPHLSRPLMKMFADDYVEMEDKTEKKIRQKQRKQEQEQREKCEDSVSAQSNYS